MKAPPLWGENGSRLCCCCVAGPKASVERPWRRRRRGAARLRRRVEPWTTVCSSALPWCRTGAAARAGLPTLKGRLAKSLHHPRTALRYALREVCQFDEGGRIRQLLADPSDTSRAHPRPNSLHVLTLAQHTRTLLPLGIGFCAIWVCISSSSSSYR